MKGHLACRVTGLGFDLNSCISMSDECTYATCRYEQSSGSGKYHTQRQGNHFEKHA